MVNPPQRQTRKQTAASVVWAILSILCGWSLFFYWWATVLTETQTPVVVHLLKELAAIVAILVASVCLWILHNRRLASRGRRGNATRFRAPIYDTDHLNRRLILPRKDALRTSPELRVSTIDSNKIYDADPL